MPPAVRKAVVPVAGLGTRLRPISCVVPKAMMPLADRRGRVLPVLHYVLAEAAAAGIEEAAVIVSPPHEDMLRRYLEAARQVAPDMPKRVELVIQQQPLGFGHAVLMGKDVVGPESFMLLLGDHVYVAQANAQPCAAQVAHAFAQRGGAAMIGMQPVDASELPRVGVAGGVPLGNGVFRCTDFIEKPSLAAAKSRLATPGLKDGEFLAHCGTYIFGAEVFDCLEELAARPRESGKEIQLADAQSMLLKRSGDRYFLCQIRGRAYDTGTPEGYAATVKAFG